MGICCKAFDQHWTPLNSLSIHVTFTVIVPGAYNYIGEAKMCKNVLKWRTCKRTGWITGKRLKIDGYMLRGVWQWQALNSLLTHVTFTAIVPGAYRGRPKCAKMANYGLNYWEMVEDRCVHAAMLWQALNPLFIHVTFTAIVPWA